jgi:hypothetical protein
MGTDRACSLLFCAAKRSGAFPPNMPAGLRARRVQRIKLLLSMQRVRSSQIGRAYSVFEVCVTNSKSLKCAAHLMKFATTRASSSKCAARKTHAKTSELCNTIDVFEVCRVFVFDVLCLPSDDDVQWPIPSSKGRVLHTSLSRVRHTHWGGFAGSEV